MDAKSIEYISQQIYAQFPEVEGDVPTVKAQAAAKSPERSASFLLTYKASVQSGNGPTFSRTVRVVANDAGKILKVTTSR
ncbi:MAG: hypothetical protein ACRDFQ_07405 [Anaerolineales bacterium]